MRVHRGPPAGVSHGKRDRQVRVRTAKEKDAKAVRMMVTGRKNNDKVI